MLQSYVKAGGELTGLSDAELFCLDLMKVSWCYKSPGSYRGLVPCQGTLPQSHAMSWGIVLRISAASRGLRATCCNLVVEGGGQLRGLSDVELFCLDLMTVSQFDDFTALPCASLLSHGS